MMETTKKEYKIKLEDLKCNEVIDYGSMFVNPKYTGNSLQYQILQELDKYCMNLGYKFAVGTTHPNNIYSINTLLKNDFKLQNQRQFTKELRNIYLKNINSK